jgi:hypothetical protein
MHLHAAPMPDRETLQAAMYGPLVLAARFEEEPREKWYRHFAAQEKQEPAPILKFKGKPVTRRVGSNPRRKTRIPRGHKIKPWCLYLCRASCMNGTPYTTTLMRVIPEGANFPIK